MKRTFKFFTMAAIVAAGFTACSNEDIVPNPGPNPTGGGEAQGTPTNATFNFKLSGASAETRGLNTADMENSDVKEFRVLIFDVDNKLEVDTARSLSAANDSLLTISLNSGSKRIFVYANGGISQNTTPAYLTIPAKGAITPSTKINDVYSLVTGGTPYTDLANMHLLYPKAAGERFYFSNGVNESLIGLEPGISANESKVPGTKNYINVNLDRAIAKVSVTKDATSGPDNVVVPTGTIITKDSAGIISNVTYTVWSLNARMYPFKNYVNGLFVTPEYLPAQKIDPNTTTYYVRNQGKGANNTPIDVVNRTVAPGAASYYYIPENNPSKKMKGNTTIAAVEATFVPTKYHYVKFDAANSGNSVTYNENQVAFTIYPAITDLSTASDMYLFTQKGINGLVENTLFAGPGAIRLAKKIVYHLDNPKMAESNDMGIYDNIPDADVAKYFVKFTNGKAYYRLNIGEQNGNMNNYTVTRNYYYDTNIKGFLKLGENEAVKLVQPENEILEGPTSLSVHIILRQWTGATVNTNI